jgi:hypothetical protein
MLHEQGSGPEPRFNLKLPVQQSLCEPWVCECCARCSGVTLRPVCEKVA